MNMPNTIDLRSDTVTLPTPAMWCRMREAELGDDGLDRDPTVLQLERKAAELLGKQSAVFVPSVTQGNLIAIMAAAGRGQQVVAESESHIYTVERGGASLAGAFYAPVRGIRGAMLEDELTSLLNAERGVLPTALICLETSHNNAGGAVLPLAHMARVREIASDRGILVHLDGARLFNAATALRVNAETIAMHADTVAICLSKGLSAPVGALLAGSANFIEKALDLRKTLGGSQRQAGIMAAAGCEALDSMVSRLHEDHALAALLSAELNESGAGVVADTPETNIVMVTVPSKRGSSAWVTALEKAGVRVRAWGPHKLRCVTHRHITALDISGVVAAFTDIESVATTG